MVVSELAYFSYKSYEKREAVSGREFKNDNAGYNDGTIEALNFIKSKDNAKFYRIEKDYQSGNAIHGSLNDAMAQGYYGTTSYSSFNQLNYVRFLEETELIPKGDETATRWLSGLRNYPILQTFGNVKYVLSKSENPEFERFGFERIAEQNKIKILRNLYAVPFGYTYDSYIEYNDYKSLLSYLVSPQSLQNIYMESLSKTGNKAESEQLMLSIQSLLNKKFDDKEDFIKDLKGILTSDVFEKHHRTVLKFSTVTFLNQLALLNAFVYEKESGFDVSDFKKIDPDDTTAIIPPEKFNFEKYKAFTAKLKSDTLIITDFNQHSIKGTISLKQKKLLFLTIPYDKAWKIKVNGKVDQLFRVNLGFTGIPLTPGNYQIELYYEPPYTGITRTITYVTVVLFWSWLAFTIIRKRRKQKHNSDV